MAALIFFPNPNAQQMFSHHSLGSIAVYLSHAGACASHGAGPGAVLHQLPHPWPQAACSLLSLPAQGEGKLGRTCQEMSELGMVAPASRSKKPSNPL